MTKKTRLIVARHGNTFSKGEVVRRVGTTDLPLVAGGLAQGRALGVYLKENQLIPDVIITSELKRAIETAEQAQKAMQTHLSIETLAMFNEIDYGPDENQPEEKVLARIGIQALKDWEAKAVVPIGWNVDPKAIIHSWQDIAKQIVTNQTGKTILIITSNGIARFSPYLTGDFEAFSQQYEIKIATGALSVFENTQGDCHWTCREWNTRPPLFPDLYCARAQF